MSAAKHSQGIWVTNPTDGIPAIGIDPCDGGGLLPIADVVHGATKEEALKNRQLMATSPALLEVLKALLAVYQPNIKAYRPDAPRRALWLAAVAVVDQAESNT